MSGLPRVVIAVTGGRDFADRTRAFVHLDRLHVRCPIGLLVHGDARGADHLANEWAIGAEVHVARVPAQWERLGHGAGTIRNSAILLTRPHGLVAFPGGAGTANMLRQARTEKVPTWEPLAAPESPALGEFVAQVLAKLRGHLAPFKAHRCPMCGTSGYTGKCGFCNYEAVNRRGAEHG